MQHEEVIDGTKNATDRRTKIRTESSIQTDLKAKLIFLSFKPIRLCQTDMKL